MTKLILLRHGESVLNKHNVFTGCIDIPLTKKGVEECFKAGELLAEVPIDVIFSSSLIRAQMSAMLVMSLHKEGKIPYIVHEGEGKQAKWSQNYSEEKDKYIPMFTAWQLNERMYGKLQGLNKQETKDKFGKEQVHLWRRSFDVSPPEGESLEMTAERSIPYFEEKILPYLKQGKNVLISAHGNSLRSIVMVLENLSKEELLNLEIPTGKAFIYTYSGGKFLKDGA
jgi:2,3-bisphosphoglycerate-dependent phosphoglycerate mutase